ncbi:MAG: PEP-CTERM sorting domain-containing protein [Pirellulales bacterium]|nr:PEP-CTERM sorting domain-containing protein [Pirellulales bacterium]
MSHNISKHFLSRALACALAVALAATQAVAGTVSFTNISQSTQTPGDPPNLYGPADTSTPNQLLFPAPAAFSATAIGPGGADITDGLLTFTVSVNDPLTGITGINFFENGTWALLESVPGFAGLGTNVRNAIAGFVTVTSVNGVAVGGPTIPFSGANVSFNAVADLPPGSGFWNNGAGVGLGAIPGLVTSIDVAINNRLVAFSEGGPNGTSISFIDKKRITIRIDTEMIPEPSSIALLVTALGGLGVVAGRRR